MGLTERLFLSTDRSQFKMGVNAQDKMSMICLFAVNFNRGFIVLFNDKGCPKYFIEEYACDILSFLVYLQLHG